MRRGGVPALLRGLRRLANGDPEQSLQVAYGDFIRQETAEFDSRRERLLAEVAGIAGPPVIEIVLVSAGVGAEELTRSIESLQAQVWPHWRLWLREGSAKPELLTCRMVYWPDEMPAASMFGDDAWVTFVRCGDLLAPDALLEVARAAICNPSAALIYTDEDVLDADGRRYRPDFKPDWNIDLFLSFDMLGSLSCYRGDLLNALGGMRPPCGLAERYDLGLRASERLEPGQIVHVSRVLYHRKSFDKTFQPDGPVGRGCGSAERCYLREYLARNGVRANVEESGSVHRVVYELPSPPPRVSIIIATRDRLDLLRGCIDSIRSITDYPDYEIIVIDNGSRKARTIAWLQELEARGVIRVARSDGPFNFSALNNLGASLASGDILALLNNDIEVGSADWLTEMVGVCLQPGVGVVGAKLYYPEGAIQHAGLVLNPETVASHWFGNCPKDYGGPRERLKARQRLSAVTGACLVTPKPTYEELGGLDARHLAVAYNDVDYCLRVDSSGRRVVFTPHAKIIHRESASRGSDAMPRKLTRLHRELAFMKHRWRDVLRRDPWAMPGAPASIVQRGWSSA